VRVGINGFGRIGRNVLRAARQRAASDLEVVAVNDLADPPTLAHLFKYDSIMGTYAGEVEAEGQGLSVDGHAISVSAERDPAKIPWRSAGVEVVVEATGRYTDARDARRHLDAGASKVLISAPAKNEDVTVVMGVNEKDYQPDRHQVISNASCTTNCLAPLAKVVLDELGIETALMTTAHSYTNDQLLLDGPHRDLRRARAAALSIIPTSTGAARALALVLPELKGRVDGLALRVPTPDVSLVDLSVLVRRDTDPEGLNQLLRLAAGGAMKGILEVSDVPLVSTDFRGNSASCVVDADSTMVVGGKHVKLLAWYDNEWGYSCRLVDLALYVAARAA
jgi:glyceraldehyde 3-phosphate dehydrogenase